MELSAKPEETERAESIAVSSEFSRVSGAAAELERKARKVLERRAGRTFDDAEWKRMRAKVAEFYAIVRAWEEPPIDAAEKDKIVDACR